MRRFVFTGRVCTFNIRIHVFMYMCAYIYLFVCVCVYIHVSIYGCCIRGRCHLPFLLQLRVLWIIVIEACGKSIRARFFCRCVLREFKVARSVIETVMNFPDGFCQKISSEAKMMSTFDELRFSRKCQNP